METVTESREVAAEGRDDRDRDQAMKAENRDREWARRW